MIDVDKIPILCGNKTTLKETSKSNHTGTNTFMTESALTVINFDAVKNDYAKKLKLSEPPASNDALFVSGAEALYFIRLPA